ncbi:MAG: LysR substrate-binding domain-containing protein [Rhodospirillales bacterium]
MRYLVTVAETLSFRRAAELCHVSQPTLSDQIRELEARLKVQLIERTRRKVVMTPVGREIAERARRVLRDVQDIIDLAERGRHVLAGTLRLGVLPSLGPYLLPLVLPYLHQRYPDLSLYLREDTAEDLLRRLEDGELDLLIFPIPVRREGFATAALFREPLWLALPKGHPLTVKNELTLSDLEGLTVLALETGHSLHRKVLALCRENGANPLLDFATTSLDTLRQMAAMGVGATFLPALYVRAETGQDRQITVLPFAEPAPGRNIGLVWRAQSARRSAYLALAQHIRDVLIASVPEVVPLTDP